MLASRKVVTNFGYLNSTFKQSVSLPNRSWSLISSGRYSHFTYRQNSLLSSFSAVLSVETNEENRRFCATEKTKGRSQSMSMSNCPFVPFPFSKFLESSAGQNLGTLNLRKCFMIHLRYQSSLITGDRQGPTLLPLLSRPFSNAQHLCHLDPGRGARPLDQRHPAQMIGLTMESPRLSTRL